MTKEEAKSALVAAIAADRQDVEDRLIDAVHVSYEGLPADELISELVDHIADGYTGFRGMTDEEFVDEILGWFSIEGDTSPEEIEETINDFLSSEEEEQEEG